MKSYGFKSMGQLTLSPPAESSIRGVDAGQAGLALADLAGVRQAHRGAAAYVAVGAAFTEEALTGRHVWERIQASVREGSFAFQRSQMQK